MTLKEMVATLAVKGFTTAAIAARLNKSIQTVESWSNGNVIATYGKTIDKALREFDVDISECKINHTTGGDRRSAKYKKGVKK